MNRLDYFPPFKIFTLVKHVPQKIVCNLCNVKDIEETESQASEHIKIRDTGQSFSVDIDPEFWIGRFYRGGK